MTRRTRPGVTRRDTLKWAGLAGLGAALPPFAQVAGAADAAAGGTLKLVRRGEPSYEATRRSLVWNLYKPARYPDVIAHPQTEADVIAAVNYARQNGLQITVRGTGHTRSASFLRDGGMLIDTGRMIDVTVDPAAKRATATPGVRAGMLATELGKHGLFFPTTHDASVGIGGFVMSGGFGWCVNRYGFAASNLEGIDVVTADGQLIHSDDEQNPEWVWCARGAGPGMFGVVTRYYLRAHDMPKAVRQSTYALPNESWDEVMSWLMTVVPTMSKDLEVYAFTNYKPGGNNSTAPPATLISISAMSDSDEEAVAALKPFEANPVLPKASIHKYAEPKDLNALFQFYGGMMIASYRYFIESAWIPGNTDRPIKAVKSVLDSPPNDLSYSLWLPFPHRKPIANAAMSFASDWCYYQVGMSRDEAGDAAARKWVLDGMNRMDTFSPGIMLNEEDLVFRPVKNVLTPENWQKYTALKAKHDPKNLFGGFRKA
jgi:hypothetical protein